MRRKDSVLWTEERQAQEWGWKTKRVMDGGTDEEGSQSSGYPGHVGCEMPQGLVGPGNCSASTLGSPVSALGEGGGSGHAELCNID